MADSTALERLLRRDYIVTISALTILIALAWIYIVSGAGMGASAWDMTKLALFPPVHPQSAMSGMDMAGADTSAPAWWPPSMWALTIAMWWVMMIAMMSPSATPAILLYARVHRHSALQGQANANLAPTGAFAAGYLFIWLAFSVAAASLQWLLVRADLVSALLMGSQSRWLSSALLVAVGLYQLSPLKGLCLEHCRSPTEFLTKHWRPGAAGAVRLGVLHGAYCVGCCWALMALLFVGGVMNLIWIAALTLLVLVEKLAPAGPMIARGLGVILVIAGVVVLFGNAWIVAR
jgi:predicted metal-binding membrane protein